MSAKANQSQGKSDPLDARRIAVAVLPLNTNRLRHPRKDGGTRAALRVVIAARSHMTSERTGTINTLIALLRAVDLGIDARRPPTSAQILEVSRWRSRAEEIGTATARAEALRLARRVIALDEELSANTKSMTTLLSQSPARVLLDMPGIGPVTAAVAMAAWSHDGRPSKRGRLRRSRGREPDPGFVRKHRAALTQPQRRSPP